MGTRSVNTIKRFIPAAVRPTIARAYRRFLARRSFVEGSKRQFAARFDSGSSEGSLLSKVSSRIHPEDGMYAGDAVHYFSVGISAVRCLELALNSRPEQTAISEVLIMPSGYGRELRFFVELLPNANFSACDILTEGVDFCAKHFGAKAVYSRSDFDDIAFEKRFDLIWCGSLITHLSDLNIRKLLSLFARSLNPNGIVVVTANGDLSSRRLTENPGFYGLTEPEAKVILETYREIGFGFHAFPQKDAPAETPLMDNDYGVTLTSPSWVRKIMGGIDGLREVYLQERGWDEHQDVYGFIKE